MDEKEYREYVARTIVQWLGGKIVPMINARDMVVLDKGRGSLQFKFSGNPDYNMCEIVLNCRDLYDMTIYKLHGGKVVRKKEFNSYYGEMLKSTFEQTTKLYLTL